LIKVDQQDEVLVFMKKNEITPERYRSILHLSLVDDLPELAPNELNFILELKEQEEINRTKKEKVLKELLLDNDFDFSLYHEIQKKYKEDLKFQRNLKPFFDKSLSRN